MIWNLCIWFSFSVITNLSKQNQKIKVIFERIEINCVNYRNWHISKVLSLVRCFKKRQCHHENIARSSSLQYTQLENWIVVDDDYLWNDERILTTLRRYATDLISHCSRPRKVTENILYLNGIHFWDPLYGTFKTAYYGKS